MKLIDYLQELWTDGRKKKVCMIAVICHQLASSHVSMFLHKVNSQYSILLIFQSTFLCQGIKFGNISCLYLNFNSRPLKLLILTK